MSHYSIEETGIFPYKAKNYFSVRQALAKGYHSKSHWRRKGREVIETAEPTLAVAKAWKTLRPREDGYYPEIVLAYNNFKYLVTTERFDSEIGKKCSWPVYSLDQTQPKAKKKRLAKTESEPPQDTSSPTNSNGADTQVASEVGFVILDLANDGEPPVDLSTKTRFQQTNNSLQSNTHSPSLPPYDGETVAETAPKGKQQHELAATINCARQNRQCRRVNTGRQGQIECRKVYFPETFPWDDYPELHRYRSAVMYVFHLLHVRRFANNDDIVYSTTDHIPLKAEYLRQVIPEWRDLRPLLIDLGLLDCDNHYETGSVVFPAKWHSGQGR